MKVLMNNCSLLFKACIIACLATAMFSCAEHNGEIIVDENDGFRIIKTESKEPISESYYLIDKTNGSSALIITDTCEVVSTRVPNKTRWLPKDSIMAVSNMKLLGGNNSSALPKVYVEMPNVFAQTLSFIVSLDSDSVVLLPANGGYVGQTRCEELLVLENLQPYLRTNDSILYSEVITFDYNGSIISRTEAKAYKNCSRELDLAVNEFNRISGRAFHWYNFSYNGMKMPYRAAELFSHRNDKPMLVVFLHGKDGVGKDNAKQLKWDMTRKIYRYLAIKDQHAIIVAPQSPIGNWDAMATTVKALIDDIVKTENVDRNRIYICGYSLGAKGTWSMIQRYPNFFAGALSAGSPSTPLTTEEQYKKTLSTPIWAGNGYAEQDATSQMNRLKGMGADVNYSYDKNWDHGAACSSVFNGECFDWMFSHEREIAAPNN